MQHNENPGVLLNRNRVGTNTINYPRLYNAYARDSFFKLFSMKITGNLRELKEIYPEFKGIFLHFEAKNRIFG